MDISINISDNDFVIYYVGDTIAHNLSISVDSLIIMPN